MKSILRLTDEQVKRADELRDLLTAAHHEVVRGERRRARAIKVGIQLSERCDKPGIEGRLKHVSTTGAIIVVRDAASKLDVEIPAAEILSHEVL